MKSKNLKIMLVSPLPPPAGGIATWTQLYTNWSKKNNIDFRLVNTALIGKRAKKINNKTNILDEIKRTLKIFRDFKSTIDNYQPNIIHLNTPCGTLGLLRDIFCAKIAQMNKTKLYVHYRCNIEDQIRDNKIKKILLHCLIKLSDENIVLNDNSQKYLLNEFSKKSTIVPNFIDENYILSTQKSISKSVKNVSFVGHVQKTKGFDEIFKVAQKLSEINFNLIGPIENNINIDNVPNNINFLGIQSKEKTRELLINSDVFLFPTYTEGFSNALLEAMSIGLPIITTPVGANKEMIENKGGILVEVGNYEEIIIALQKIDNKDLRLEMSQWNIQKVLLNYTIDSVMQKLLSLYLNSKG